MRLTKIHRGAFVRAVMDDVPKIDYDEQLRKIALEDSISQLPAAVQAIARDEELVSFLNFEYKHTGYSNGWSNTSMVVYQRSDSSFCFTEDAQDQIDKISLERVNQFDVRQRLETKISGVIEGCSTRKRAVELLPDFEKYLPTETDIATDRSVPVICDLKETLTALGFPKDKTETLVAISA